eukprot:m.226196 g.226196  ORF g.226196 m.226196 type:complete len:385 (+) comp16891_c0_seq1:204-1358(+)
MKRQRKKNAQLAEKKRREKALRHLLHVLLEVGLVRGNVPVPAGDGLLVANINLFRSQLKQAEVVRDEDHASLEGVDGLGQTFDRLHVQMVRRLIKQEHVGVFLCEPAKDETALLAVAEGTDELGLSLAADTIGAQTTAPVADLHLEVGKLLAHKIDGVQSKVQDLGTVLVVLGDAKVAVAVDLTAGGLELTHEQLEQGALAGTVGADKDDAGVEIDTKVQTSVESILGVARVGEADRLEGKHWGSKFVAGREEERHRVLDLDFLNETISLHLVKDLLTALGLAHKVCIGTAAGNKLLDVLDFLLLLGILLHLVGLVLVAGLAVLGVVATIVHQGALGCEVHDVCADVVEKVLRVRHNHENLGIVAQAVLKPDASLQIKMVGGLV